MRTLAYETATKRWSGELPAKATVRLQWWDSDKEAWQPEWGYGTARPRDEWLAILKKGIRQGPLKRDRYRLVVINDMGGPSDNPEDGNPFKAGTRMWMLFDFMKDQQPKTELDIADAAGGTNLINVTTNLVPKLRRAGKTADRRYAIERIRNSGFRMVFLEDDAPPIKPAREGNPFKEGTKAGLMYDALSDGLVHTEEEIAAAIETKSVKNVRVEYLYALRREGPRADPPFTVQRIKPNKYKLVWEQP